MDFPILIKWVSPLSFLGASSGVIFHFHLIFDENHVNKHLGLLCLPMSHKVKRTPGLYGLIRSVNSKCGFKHNKIISAPYAKWVAVCGTVSSMLSGLKTRSLGLNTLGTT